MLLVPAIDLKDGKCVRLYQGDYSKTTIYGHDPVALAQEFEKKGAKLLHVVDLSGAKEGYPFHAELIKKIVASISIPVEVGGGIRDLTTIEKYLSWGVDRVILGTIACQNLSLLQEACRLFPKRIVVSIDSKGDKVAISGWLKDTSISYLDLAQKLDEFNLRALIFTDIFRDGTQQGVNINRIKSLLEKISLPLYVAGGVSSYQDIERLLPLSPLGLEGVIIGKAIYSGNIDLSKAWALIESSN